MLVIRPLAVRNQIGRMLGAPASVAYRPDQRWVAESIWRADAAFGFDDEMCAACVADVDRECSLTLSLRGDHNEAGGGCQWHSVRRLLILKNTGIDVWIAPAADQARAMDLEMSAPWSAYRKVEGHLRAAVGLEAKCRVLIHEFEGSANQDRDLARQMPMAEFWLKTLGRAAP